MGSFAGADVTERRHALFRQADGEPPAADGAFLAAVGVGEDVRLIIPPGLQVELDARFDGTCQMITESDFDRLVGAAPAAAPQKPAAAPQPQPVQPK